jgi:hypothetical protein
MSASIFTTEDLLEHTSVVVSDSDATQDFLAGAGGQQEGGPAAGGLSPEELREYLRRLNPEDLGRFNP